MTVFYCGEDAISRAVAQRLIADFTGFDASQLGGVQGGWTSIKKKFRNFYNLSRRSPVFITIDLDRHPCPPSLRSKWLSDSGLAEPLPHMMLFCIAQTEIESWLMADRDGIADFLGIKSVKIGNDIENAVADPKKHLVQLVRRSSNKSVKVDILPASGSKSTTGPGYNDRLSEFARTRWQPLVAALESRSLDRAIKKLQALREQLPLAHA
jgi:hypothetical protein